MTGIKKFLHQIFFLIVLQGLIGSTFFASKAVDFLDGKGPHDMPVLRWETKIPAGFTDRTIHYVTLPKGTPLSDIPYKISQKREEVGLSPNIPADEQNDFLQNFPWKTAKAISIKSPLPGRVVQMNVQSGQQIAAGDIVGTIECMKMYINISAETQGEIRDVFFETGDTIHHDSTLISLLPTSPDWDDIGEEKISDNKDFLTSLFPWARRKLPKASRASPPQEEWKGSHQPKSFENKDLIILLYPWAAWSPSTPLSTPPTHRGCKSNILKAFSASELHQQALTPSEPLPRGMQNFVLDHLDQSRNVSKGSTTITHEKADQQPSLWQSSTISFQQKGIQKDEVKDISGVSSFAWAHWVCGLVMLNKLAFALQSFGCALLGRIRLKKYSFIAAAFPRTAYLRASDCNKHPFAKNQTAHNMNRLYFVRRKFG